VQLMLSCLHSHEKNLGHGFNIKTSPLKMNLCNNCLQGKWWRTKFSIEGGNKTIQLLDWCIYIYVVQCKKNLWEDHNIVIFIDDHSIWTLVSFIKQKNEMFKKIKEFKVMVKVHIWHKMKCFRSNNGGNLHLDNLINDALENYF
jgi:hypothetical protein